jgi:hypothetical protein
VEVRPIAAFGVLGIVGANVDYAAVVWPLENARKTPKVNIAIGRTIDRSSFIRELLDRNLYEM